MNEITKWLQNNKLLLGIAGLAGFVYYYTQSGKKDDKKDDNKNNGSGNDNNLWGYYGGSDNSSPYPSESNWTAYVNAGLDAASQLMKLFGNAGTKPSNGGAYIAENYGDTSIYGEGNYTNNWWA